MLLQFVSTSRFYGVSTMFPMQMACDVCACVQMRWQNYRQSSKENLSSENVIDNLEGGEAKQKKKEECAI